jgi:hypothetical protein
MLGGNGMALMGVFSGLVGKNPTLAFERLATVEDQAARQMALTGMMQHITDPGVQTSLATYLDDLPASDRTQVMSSFIGQWAMMDPESMMEFVDSRPEGERRTMLKTAGQTMLWADPDRGTEMLLENSTEKELPGTYSTIVSSLASQDATKAEAWLNNQTQGPELDRARSSFAQTVARNEPEKAMRWATTITNESQRESAVSSTYMQWRKKDEDAANAALPESGLSPEAVQRLLDQVDAQTPGTTALPAGSFEAPIEATEN